jgi:hypothetical protein
LTLELVSLGRRGFQRSLDAAQSLVFLLVIRAAAKSMEQNAGRDNILFRHKAGMDFTQDRGNAFAIGHAIAIGQVRCERHRVDVDGPRAAHATERVASDTGTMIEHGTKSVAPLGGPSAREGPLKQLFSLRHMSGGIGSQGSGRT